jgi:hypothetical protein
MCLKSSVIRRSYQVAEEIFMVDRALGTLRRHLQRRALQVDLLVVSPHGIADTTNMTWRLDLADFVDFRNLHFVVGRGAHADIKVKQHIDPAKVYPDLLNWGAMKVYNVSSMPKRMRVSKVKLCFMVAIFTLNFSLSFQGRMDVGFHVGFLGRAFVGPRSLAQDVVHTDRNRRRERRETTQRLT